MAADPNWSSAESLPFVDARCHQLAVAATAKVVHLVWTQERMLYHAQHRNGAWQPPVRIAGGEQPALVSTPDGALYCAYANSFLGNRDIYVIPWDGTEWGLSQRVSRTTGQSSDPAICVTATGALHLAWADTTGPSCIYHASRKEGAWISSPIPNGKGSKPTIAANDQKVVVAWQDRLASSTTGAHDVLAAIKVTEWSLPDLVSDTPETHSLLPQVALNGNGQVHLVWQEARDGLFVIRHSDLWPAGWTAPADVSDPAVDSRLAWILPDRNGLFHCVWSEGTLLKHRVRPGKGQGTWWKPEVACETCGGLSTLAAAISPMSGELHLVFSQYVNGVERHMCHMRRKPVELKKIFLPVVGR